MTFRWEVRQLLRWGSRHERWFASVAEAEAYAKAGAGADGTWKRVGDTFFFSPYPDEA
jgi:hypothetical protein